MKWILLLLITTNVYAIDYGQALSVAKDAAIIQVGIPKIQSQVERHLSSEVERFGLTRPIVIGGFIYTVFRTQQLPIRLHKKLLTIKPNSVTITLEW